MKMEKGICTFQQFSKSAKLDCTQKAFPKMTYLTHVNNEIPLTPLQQGCSEQQELTYVESSLI